MASQRHLLCSLPADHPADANMLIRFDMHVAGGRQRNPWHVRYQYSIGQFIRRLFHANMAHFLCNCLRFTNDRLSRDYLRPRTFTGLGRLTDTDRPTHPHSRACNSPAW